MNDLLEADFWLVVSKGCVILDRLGDIEWHFSNSKGRLLRQARI